MAIRRRCAVQHRFDESMGGVCSRSAVRRSSRCLLPPLQDNPHSSYKLLKRCRRKRSSQRRNAGVMTAARTIAVVRNE